MEVRYLPIIIHKYIFQNTILYIIALFRKDDNTLLVPQYELNIFRIFHMVGHRKSAKLVKRDLYFNFVIVTRMLLQINT